MSRTVSIKAIAFVLGLSIGVGVNSFASRLFTERSTVVERSTFFVTTIDDVRPITIYSVPSVDFPETIKKTGSIYASVKLVATFDADGSVKSVGPYPMIPFGASESAAGVGEFAGVTPFTIEGKFVDSLPAGLTASALRQALGITYKPKTRNGQSEAQRVFLLTDYRYTFTDPTYTETRFNAGCGAVDLTIMDDTGILWQGNTWVSRDVGCRGLR